MKIIVASLLVSQLALAETPAPSADVPNPAPAAKAAPVAKAGATAAPSAATEVKKVDELRLVTPVAFWAVAGVSVATLIFAIVMDSIATGTRRGIPNLTNAPDVLAAQNTAVQQTNIANVGYGVGAVFGLATAVLARFTRWND
jgi:hypothetical protein